MSINTFLTTTLSKIRSVLKPQKSPDISDYNGSVFHISEGIFRNKFFVIIDDSSGLVIKIILLPEAENHTITVDEFNLGLNNNIITFIEKMPNHIFDVCKEQFEHNNNNNEHISN